MPQPIATEFHAQQIIQILDGLPLTQQLACLIAMIFSHVISATDQHNPALADQVMRGLIGNLPHQWDVAKAALIDKPLLN